METICEYNELRIPDYALSYLVNNDSSGITEEDKENIDNFMEQFYKEAEGVNGQVIFDTEEEESYFSWYPEFGLACNIVHCTVLIVR